MGYGDQRRVFIVIPFFTQKVINMAKALKKQQIYNYGYLKTYPPMATFDSNFLWQSLMVALDRNICSHIRWVSTLGDAGICINQKNKSKTYYNNPK